MSYRWKTNIDPQAVLRQGRAYIFALLAGLKTLKYMPTGAKDGEW